MKGKTVKMGLMKSLLGILLSIFSVLAVAQTRLRGDLLELTPLPLPSVGAKGQVRWNSADGKIYTWDLTNSEWDKVGPLTNADLPVMVGATTGVAGVGGAVPAPGAGEQDYLLSGAGEWVPAGAGTVTQVGVSVPSSFLSVAGSPVTSSGTITISLSTQAANTVFAGPSSGSNAVPSFRALVANDIPSLPGSKIDSGLVGVTTGGTGANLSATGGTGHFLKQSTVGGAVTVGLISSAELPTHTHAAADVVSGQLALARGGTATDLSSTGGTAQVLKQLTAGGTISVATLSASELPSHTHAAGDIVSGTLGVDRGGTGASTFASNGVLLGNGTSNITATSAGSAGQILRVPGGGGAPAFGALDLSSSGTIGSSILPTANGGTGVTTQVALRALQTDASGNHVASSVTSTELAFVSGVTAGIQGQINTISAGGSTAAAQIAALQGATTSLQNQVTANSAAISSLQGLTSGVAASIASLQVATSLQATQISALQGATASLQTQVTANANGISALQGLTAATSANIAALQVATALQATQISALQGATASIQTQVSANSASISSLQGLTAGVAANIAALQVATGTQATQIAALQGATTSLQTQINANSASIGALQGLTAGVDAAIAALQVSSATHTTQIAANSAAISSLQGLTAGTAASISALQGATTLLQDQVTALQGATAAHTGQIAALQSATSLQATQISALQGATTSLFNGLTALQGTTAATAAAISALQGVTGSFVLKDGSTMTGNLTIATASNPTLVIEGVTGTSRIVNFNSVVAGSSTRRFAISVNGIDESGSNAGSNFAVNRYSDSGSFLGTFLQGTRSDGTAIFENRVQSASLGTNVAPIFSFSTDTDTGIYSPSANNLSVAVSGVQVLNVSTSGSTFNSTLSVTNTGTSITASGTISAAQDLFVGQAGSGSGGKLRIRCDSGSECWRLGPGGGAGDTDFIFRSIPLNAAVITISTAGVAKFNRTALAKNGLTTIGGTAYTQIAGVTVANSTSETTLMGASVGTRTISANSLAAGDTIVGTFGGLMGCTAAPNLVMRFKGNSTNHVAQTVTPSTIDMGGDTENYCDNTLKPFNITLRCTVRTTGASGTLFCAGGSIDLFANNKGGGKVNFGASSTSTIDTTTSQVLDVTAQWDAADVNNQVQFHTATFEVK